MRKLRVLDLFSGIGGFSLGLERTGGFETVAFCEIEEFPRKVLKKHWPEVPCFEDVRTLTRNDIDGPVDVICGGYPCQPFSTAGKRQGKEDDRHLWPEFSRLVDELRPAWVIGENVAGHISMGLDDVLSDLERQGYTCRTFVIPACAVGAHHRRDRCWTIAHSSDFLQPRELVDGGDTEEARGSQSSHNCQGETSQRERLRAESGAGSENVGHAKGERCGKARESGSRQEERTASASPAPSHVANAPSERQQGQSLEQECSETLAHWEADQLESVSRPGIWLPEPSVGRVANGVPHRMDRLKALGNAVVPQIPEMIGRAILQARVAA